MPSPNGTQPPFNDINDHMLFTALNDAFLQGALPGENEGFAGQACEDATAFTLNAMRQRPENMPVIAMESASTHSAENISDGKTDRRYYLRLAIINDDMPFLVDSIAGEIGAAGLAIDRIIHPLVSVQRDKAGQLLSIDEGARGEGIKESVVYIEMQRADAKVRRQLVAALEQVLKDTRAVVNDWRPLQDALAKDAAWLEDAEGRGLLEWLLDRNFTQLAHIRWSVNGDVTDRKGLARVSDRQLLAPISYKKAAKWFADGNAAPLVIKSNSLSTVHRRVPMDLVIVPIGDGDKVEGLSVHAGIWTSAALAAPPSKVPVLRAQLARINKKYGFDPAGHAGKALAHALTKLPHDLLLPMSQSDIEMVALTSMSLADRPRPKLITIGSALGRHLLAFVWLPRDDVSTGRRIAIENMLKQATNSPVLSWSITLEDGQIALLRYVLDLRGDGRIPDSNTLDNQLKTMVRGWLPEVENALSAMAVSGRSMALALRYAEAFPDNYRASYGADEAALDIVKLRALDKNMRRSARLCVANDALAHISASGVQSLRLKLYQVEGAIALSEAVPVLEQFGFDVLEEVPTPLAGGVLGYIHDFQLQIQGRTSIEDIVPRAAMLEKAIANVLDGRAEADHFNQLITLNGLSEFDVLLLRSWFRYLRQTGLSYGVETVVDALRLAPKVTADIMTLFHVRHDPDFADNRVQAQQRAIRAIAAGLKNVSAIDDDRLLRLMRDLVLAIIRTNAFAPSGREALAFKIDSSMVPGLPKPVPWREVFVYSPIVEGIHLRTGPVARGGLRWSDRRDDFRTEILGLMKAQRVKNAVIVPGGAKGGFFPKALPDPSIDRAAWAEAGKSAYKIFMASLLSITDNIVDGQTVHPDQVVIHDGEDPYFVVAADKGTATFSDTANAIAIERDFWLGDAFASGGSNGYDHKAMGITARGAWVSVQRHFLEMGVDVQSEPISVVGCGDMSGDVFGNGMLLSKSIKLVAAFNHMHIFIDPDPDPENSWQERKRLFEMPGSSWADYDHKLLSKGGAIFARDQKSVKLTPQIKHLLGLEDDELAPDDLIRAVLLAQADLLWFGGIGTYVKAASESNMDVADTVNDSVRVDAEQLRFRVMGEGANLGITQAARIAFALNNGRVNTDFIDNSAGVDCSDNEVNIKIALSSEVRSGALNDRQRNSLLEEMTDDVSFLVLEDNRLQTLGLSIAESGGAAALPSYLRIIETFEEQNLLDRAVEGLAANDILKRRIGEDQGLSRPELAVLMSTAKLALQDAIEQSDWIDDALLDDELAAAFPQQLRIAHPDAIQSHQLRKEIIATKLANRVINRLGISHPMELAEEEGCSLSDIAMAFVAAEHIFALPDLWAAIDIAPIDERVRLMVFDRVAQAVRSQMADIVRNNAERLQPGAMVAALQKPAAQLSDEVDSLLNNQSLQQYDALETELVSQGVSGEIAARVAHLYKIDGIIGLSRLSNKSGIAPDILARAFTDIGERLSLDWVQLTAAQMSPSDPWERLLVAGMARDFQQMRLDYLADSDEPLSHVDQWAQQNAARITLFRRLVERAQNMVPPSISMLAQIASQARILLARS